MTETTAEKSGYVTIDGDRFIHVGNKSLLLDVGYATDIFKDLMTRKQLEGVAVIRQIKARFDSDGLMTAMVEFVDEPGELYYRTIYTR